MSCSSPCAGRRDAWRALVAAAAAALLPVPRAQATAASSAAPPPPAAGWRLRGQARLRLFGFSVYDATLWAPEGFDPAAYEQWPFALELRYLRNFDGRAIAQRSLEEMQRLAPVYRERAQRWLAAMRRAFPDVKAGDRIAGVHLPGRGARFFHNGQERPGIDDAEFAMLFFSIWLSPSTSVPDFRARLLGAGGPP